MKESVDMEFPVAAGKKAVQSKTSGSTSPSLAVECARIVDVLSYGNGREGSGNKAGAYPQSLLSKSKEPCVS